MSAETETVLSGEDLEEVPSSEVILLARAAGAAIQMRTETSRFRFMKRWRLKRVADESVYNAFSLMFQSIKAKQAGGNRVFLISIKDES